MILQSRLCLDGSFLNFKLNVKNILTNSGQSVKMIFSEIKKEGEEAMKYPKQKLHKLFRLLFCIFAF